MTSAGRGADCCTSRWLKPWNAAAKAKAHERDARLAEHYERAHVWSKALRYLVLAGERSQTLFAMRDALHWLDRAVALSESHPESLDERQRLAIYERRGAARAQAGQTQGAVADIRRVIDAARAGGEREKTRDALIQLGMAYRRADAYEEATACLTEALAESRAMNDERHAADTLYHLGHGRVEHRAERPGDRIPPAGGRDLRAHGFRRSRRGAGLPRPRRGALRERGARGGDRVLHAVARACPRHRRQELRVREPDDDRARLRRDQGARRLPARLANFEAALDIARAADLQWHIGPTLLGLDHVRACTGRYGEAWAGMRKTLRWLESLRQVRYQLIAYDFIGHLLLDLGLNERRSNSWSADSRSGATPASCSGAPRSTRTSPSRGRGSGRRTSRRRCRPRSNKRAAPRSAI